jgi:hypothetical protein
MLEGAPHLDELVETYHWVTEIEAWTVAVVEGVTRDHVLGVYGANPDRTVGDYLFAQLPDLQGNDPYELALHVQVFEHGKYVVAIENNGWSGSHAEVARRCSVGLGRFFSVYWNANAFGLLTQAISGTVTARFESLDPVAPIEYAHEIRPDWAIGPETELRVVRQTSFALMEQQTGLAFDPYWLGQQRPTYRIPEPYSLFRDVPGADQP